MDRIFVNDLEMLLKGVKKVLVVCDGKVLIVDVETSTVADVTNNDVSVENSGDYIYVGPKGAIARAFHALAMNGDDWDDEDEDSEESSETSDEEE